MRGAKDLLNTNLNKKSFTKMQAFASITIAAEEADKFLDAMVDKSALMSKARVIKHTRETKNIRHLGFGSGRFLKPASTFSSNDYKKQFSNNVITLSTVKLRGAVVIYDDDLEDGIEGKAFSKHLMDLVSKQMANELEEICWMSENTVNMSNYGANDPRSLLNGWRYIIDNSQTGDAYNNAVTGGAVILDASNTVTARAASYTLASTKYIAEQNGSAPYNWEFKYGKMLDNLPIEYQKDVKNYNFFNNPKVTNRYLEALEARSTALGDQMIVGSVPAKYRNTSIVDVPLMPATMEIYSAGQHENYDADNGTLTDVLYCNPKNLIVNFQRQLKMEPERSAADEATYFFYSIRMGVNIEDVHACVLLKRLVP